MISKGFARPPEQVHLEFLKLYDTYGINFNPEKTTYFKRMLNIENKTDGEIEFYSLPESINTPPTWWVMPWGKILRPLSPTKPLEDRKQRAINQSRKFILLYKSILEQGFCENKSPPIRGYTLIDKDKNKAFNYIDGHHRIAIVQHLNETNKTRINEIRIENLGTITNDNLVTNKNFIYGIENSHFSKEEAFALFEHVFNVLSSADYRTQ